MFVALVIFVTGCSTADTSSTQKALHFKGGAFSSQSFEGCVNPSTKDFNGPGDRHYVYPVDLRSYDATGRDGSETTPIEVISKEGERVTIPVTVAFYLKDDCETLLDFHNTIGAKYSAFNNDEGKVSGGWDKMLHFAVGGPLNVTLDRISSDEEWLALYTDETLRAKLEQDVAKTIPSLIAQKTGGKQFFDEFVVTVEKPDLVNTALKDAISSKQTSREQGLAAEAKAVAEGKARVAEANAARDAALSAAQAKTAEVQVARAEAAKRAAEIAGYGSVDEYNKAKAIERGINPYQPTYGGAPVVTP